MNIELARTFLLPLLKRPKRSTIREDAVKEGYTKKLYWGKWSHKVTLNLGQTDEDKPSTQTAMKKTLKSTMDFLKATGEEFKTLSTYTYSQSTKTSDKRWQSYHSYYLVNNSLTLYFKSAQLLKDLLADKKLGGIVTYVEKPFSDGHLEALEVERMVVRKTLWWDRYRYAARLKPQARNYGFPRVECELEQDIRQWIDDQLIKACKRYEDVDYRFTSSGYYKTVMHLYFAHASDAMMFRLAFGQHVKHNERIKLLSELKDTPQELSNAAE
jgi:hypothetical protein